MRNKVFVVALVVIIALSSAQPVVAADFNLNIHNNTEDDVKIKLDGPEDYSFTVAPGKTYKTVEEGDYEYSYGACGEKVSGEVTVDNNDEWLIIDPCPDPVFFEKFVVDSHLPESVTLSLSGPQDYELAVSLGTNKFIELQTGEYFFSYDACDTTISGVVNITKNGKARITLKSCEVRQLLDFGLPNPVNLRIGSHYAFPVAMTLIGPRQYYVQVQPGLNRFDVIDGTYEYFYTAYGQTHGGTFIVRMGGAGVTISPLAPSP